MITLLMDPNTQREDLENQVWSAIAAFEQIVETIPDDRVSLEALSHAYEQVGDLSRAREFLARLVDVVIRDADQPAAQVLQERVVLFASSDPIARELQSRLEAFLLKETPAPQTFTLADDERLEELRKAEEAEQRSAHLAAELAFAWTLFQSGELTQEEYAAVAQDLGQLSGNTAATTVSVLHALNDRGSRGLDHVLAFVAKDTNLPLIPAAQFDTPDAVWQMIPRDFSVRNGVIAFELMGQDLLVAVLNPYHKALREKVESLTGRRCHFFICLPADFDAVMEKRGKAEAAKPV